jgi:hypothetical protein
MGFGRSAEVLIHAEMNLHPFGLKPAAASPCHTLRLGLLRQAQRLTIESPCLLFLPDRHG